MVLWKNAIDSGRQWMSAGTRSPTDCYEQPAGYRVQEINCAISVEAKKCSVSRHLFLSEIDFLKINSVFLRIWFAAKQSNVFSRCFYSIDGIIK